jgi:WD repeat and SOF domain-containing protein 1
MRVKAISRNPDVYERDTNQEANRVFRNLDPEMHPFEKSREYARALASVKLDKVFNKPFVRAMGGHMEGVFSMAKHTTRLPCVVSGACDGEIRVWNAGTGQCNASIKAAHTGFVRGLTVVPSGEAFLSCGSDAVVKLWPLLYDVYDKYDVDARPHDRITVRPLQTFVGEEAFNAVDHQYGTDCFATVSSKLQIWDVHRSHPLTSIAWGPETSQAVRWNHAEPNVLASAASDRTVTLYDARAKTALKKVVLPGRSNAMCWNPREPYYFTCANEDTNLYTFDMRYLNQAVGVHRDFLSSVMSVDYSPTGREFVAGSYDMTVRIFPVGTSSSREVYFTRRMNRVFSVLFSQDARFVLSGSDDANIRVWKAEAAAPVALLHPRAREKLEYRDKLKRKYGHMPQIKRIAKHRHVPLFIHNAKKKKKVMLAAANLKRQRVLIHRKPGSVPDVGAKEAAVQGQED